MLASSRLPQLWVHIHASESLSLPAERLSSPLRFFVLFLSYLVCLPPSLSASSLVDLPPPSMEISPTSQLPTSPCYFSSFSFSRLLFASSTSAGESSTTSLLPTHVASVLTPSLSEVKAAETLRPPYAPCDIQSILLLRDLVVVQLCHISIDRHETEDRSSDSKSSGKEGESWLLRKYDLNTRTVLQSVDLLKVPLLRQQIITTPTGTAAPPQSSSSPSSSSLPASPLLMVDSKLFVFLFPYKIVVHLSVGELTYQRHQTLKQTFRSLAYDPGRHIVYALSTTERNGEDSKHQNNGQRNKYTTAQVSAAREEGSNSSGGAGGGGGGVLALNPSTFKVQDFIPIGCARTSHEWEMESSASSDAKATAKLRVNNLVYVQSLDALVVTDAYMPLLYVIAPPVGRGALCSIVDIRNLLQQKPEEEGANRKSKSKEGDYGEEEGSKALGGLNGLGWSDDKPNSLLIIQKWDKNYINITAQNLHALLGVKALQHTGGGVLPRESELARMASSADRGKSSKGDKMEETKHEPIEKPSQSGESTTGEELGTTLQEAQRPTNRHEAKVGVLADMRSVAQKAAVAQELEDIKPQGLLGTFSPIIQQGKGTQMKAVEVVVPLTAETAAVVMSPQKTKKKDEGKDTTEIKLYEKQKAAGAADMQESVHREGLPGVVGGGESTSRKDQMATKGTEELPTPPANNTEVDNLVYGRWWVYRWVSWIFGLVYVTAWAVSFYPQLVMNCKRKSVTGMSFDLIVYNIVGYSAYSIYTCVQVYVQSKTKSAHAVEVHDVFFALHSLFICCCICVQICCYDRGEQKVGKICKYTCYLILGSTCLQCLLAALDVTPWATHLSSQEAAVAAPRLHGPSLPHSVAGGRLGGQRRRLDGTGEEGGGGNDGMVVVEPVGCGTDHMWNRQQAIRQSPGCRTDNKLCDKQEAVRQTTAGGLDNRHGDGRALRDSTGGPQKRMRVEDNDPHNERDEKGGVQHKTAPAKPAAEEVAQLRVVEEGRAGSSDSGVYILSYWWKVIVDTWSVAMFLGYVKVIITMVKYNPQVHLNFVSKSTEGMSVYSFVLDFTGGIFSLLQNYLDAYNYSDTTYVYGNIPKMAIGVVTLVYDSVLICQHYALYRGHQRVAPVAYTPVRGSQNERGERVGNEGKCGRKKTKYDRFGFEIVVGGTVNSDVETDGEDGSGDERDINHKNGQQPSVIGSRSRHGASATCPTIRSTNGRAGDNATAVESPSGRLEDSKAADAWGGETSEGEQQGDGGDVAVGSNSGSGSTSPARKNRRSPINKTPKEDEVVRDPLLMRLPTMDIFKKRKASDV
eukprot:GHVS01031650.1.p1 GENE.GHVS01031650.1~~GHVS01031650.1.p1  ORF type:complete len:1307 (+),score=241.80 GHVS01031650.1:329-4249(+)